MWRVRDAAPAVIIAILMEGPGATAGQAEGSFEAASRLSVHQGRGDGLEVRVIILQATCQVVLWQMCRPVGSGVAVW